MSRLKEDARRSTQGMPGVACGARGCRGVAATGGAASAAWARVMARRL